MFTGLVQTRGTVRNVASDGHGGRQLTIVEPDLAPQLTIGESIAVDGACMTVVSKDGEAFDFQVGPESLAKTTLGSLIPGDRVNLERALRAGDLLGGHFVTGHIDCTGTLVEKHEQGEWTNVWFSFPTSFGELLIEKGSIAVNGVSLTVVEVQPYRFSVMLIPHTRDNTSLGQKTPGTPVNLEFDMLAKHVRKLVQNLNISV